MIHAIIDHYIGLRVQELVIYMNPDIVWFLMIQRSVN